MYGEAGPHSQNGNTRTGALPHCAGRSDYVRADVRESGGHVSALCGIWEGKWDIMEIAGSVLVGTEDIRYLLASVYLGICGLQDLRTQRVSCGVAAAAGCAAVVLDLRACIRGDADVVYWLAALIPGVFLLALSFLAEGAAGRGDGICFLVVGAYLGCGMTAAVLMAALVLASLCGLVFLVLRKVGRKTRLPFLSFAAAAWAGFIVLRIAGICW